MTAPPRRYRSPWARAVASMLADARKAGGYTQAGLGALLGKGRQTIRRIERGQVEPSGTTIDAWLAACGWESEIHAGPDVAWMSSTVAMHEAIAGGFDLIRPTNAQHKDPT